MKPFVIQCVTCQSQLRISGEDLLGTILNCPGCGSMVSIPESSPAMGSGRQPGDSKSSRWQKEGAESEFPVSDMENNETVDDFAYQHDSNAGLGGRLSATEDIVSIVEDLRQEPLPVDDEQEQLPSTDAWLSDKTQRRSRQVMFGGMIAVLLLVVVVFFFYHSDEPSGPLATTDDNPAPLAQPDEQADPLDNPDAEPVIPDVVEPQDTIDAPPSLEPVVDPLPADPPQPAEPMPMEVTKPEDPPGLQAAVPGEAATTDDLAGALRNFGEALATSQPAPMVTVTSEAGGQDGVEPQRVAIEVVDVAAGLAFEFAHLEISGPMSFLEFTELVSGISNLPITIDLDALAASDLQLDSPIQLSRKDITLGDLLKLVTDAHQLAVIASEGHLLISWNEQARSKLVTVDYTVPGGAPDMSHDLPGMLKELIAPQSWQEAGGIGMTGTAGDVVRVVQTRQWHIEIEKLLGQLNTARKDDPEAEPILPRIASVQDMLSQPISLNFSRETPLGTILRRLGQEAGLNFTVDWIATHPVGWSAASTTTLVTDKDPLSTVLRVFLDDLHLDYRIVDTTTIQVSVPEKTVGRSEVELHDVSRLLGEKSPKEIVLLAQAVLGRDESTGILVDMPSGRLLVRANQVDQLRVHQWLNPEP
jgi:hypothetical protein